MITIKLTNGYYIEREGMDHVLKQEYLSVSKKTEESKVASRAIGYFSNLENAIGRYLLLIQSNEADGLALTMKEYVEAIKMINDLTVKQIIKANRLEV